ncbi:MAG: hypothetical protein J6Y78_08935 [Paludibacteraceae bacterium]|nr:hypothetical protein [Paludibacteraceae bacterium]
MMKKLKPMKSNVYDNGADKYGNRFGGSNSRQALSLGKVHLEKWKPQEGKNVVNIIPFSADATNPLVVSGKAEEGDTLYSLDYFVHQSVGASKQSVLCLKQFGKRCPCCDESNRLRAKGEDSSLYAKRRVAYVVHDTVHDTYGVWDTGYTTVEKELVQEISLTTDENGARINPMDPENGYSVEFVGTKEQFNGISYIKPGRFRFVKRPPLTDDELNHSVDLATTMNIMDEDEMQGLFTDGFTSSSATISKPVVEEVVEEIVKEEPAQKSTNSSQCPSGYGWGTADKHPECGGCPVWDKCAFA